MNKCIFRIAFFVIAISMAIPTYANVRIAGIFSDNIVLQREMPVPIWGWADKAEKVTVSFNGQEISTVADENGKWMIRLKPMNACKEPEELKISGKNKIVIKNVLVGEVWLCSGQSNMDWGVGGCLNFKEEAAKATNGMIRFFTVRHFPNQRVVSIYPLEDFADRSAWDVCSPESVGGFYAAGYFFARKISAELDVPVGLLGIARGGTKIEPWTPIEGFRLVPEFGEILAKVDLCNPSTDTGNLAFSKYVAGIKAWLPKAEAALESKSRMPEMPVSPLPPSTDYQFPTVLYNGAVNPAIPFAIKGAIWYQGEGNGGELGPIYLNKLKALAGGWRLRWGQGDFPFYIVQLPNYGKPYPDKPGGEPICYSWSGIREAQLFALSQIPNTRLAVTIDIGGEIDLHTKNKQDTGARLAAWALAKEYGKTNLVFSGPIYRGFKVEGDKIRISFDHVGSGFMMGRKNGIEPVIEIKGDKLRQFAIAGEDKVWKWASAVIEGETIVVSHPEITHPIAVRFAFTSNPAGFNLYNKEGFPASPFRTDNW